LFCLAFSLTKDTSTMAVALGIGLGLLLCAWSVDYIPRRRARKPRPYPHGPTSGPPSP
jgi:hypothetical protein